MTRLIALDVGEARIGVARGETGLPFAFGRGVIARRTLAEDIAAVQAVLEQERADTVVVGLPRTMRGDDSAQTQRVRTFAAVLGQHGMKVVLEDERLTSRVASAGLRAGGLPKKKRQQKGRVDEAAAILILESYLAKLSHAPEG